MEPNESATPSPTTSQGGVSATNQAQPSAQTASAAQGAQHAGTSSDQKSADGKNWIEYANLQKVVEQLPQGVRDFCSNSWNQVTKMNTAQLVAGAVALAGIGYLATRTSGKSAKKGKKYRGTMPDYQRPQQSYRSEGRYSSSTGSQHSDSRRMDRGPGHWNSSFDRQNQERAGGSYQSGPGSTSPDADFGSGTSSGSSYRSTGYRGSSGSLADTDRSGSETDF